MPATSASDRGSTRRVRPSAAPSNSSATASLQKIFIAYGNLFLRVTHAVSRRQEFIADEVAAHVAGAAVMASALRKVHGAAVAFQRYWGAEVSPVLNSGYLPPLAAGFAKFVQVESVSVNVARSIETRKAEGQSDPYDTHPPLRERVAALKALPRGNSGDSRARCVTARRPARWERRLLATAINEEWARSLKPCRWDKVVDTVYVPMWRQSVKENARVWPGVTLTSLPFAGRFAGNGSSARANRRCWSRSMSSTWRCRSRCSMRVGPRRRRRARRSSSARHARDAALRGVDARRDREDDAGPVGGAVRGAGDRLARAGWGGQGLGIPLRCAIT